MNVFELIEKLDNEKRLDREEWEKLIGEFEGLLASVGTDAGSLRASDTESRREIDAVLGELSKRAQVIARETFGNKVYTRGLIEVSSYCRNDCYYCGIRRSNGSAERYRLSLEDILRCAEAGHELGFRTFVLQGGEDPVITSTVISRAIEGIKKKYPDSAVTLSLGEQSEDVYRTWFNAGADRYLLRHETASGLHYAFLHPAEMSLARRKECLWSLRDIGYQVGTGFMVGSPAQTAACLAEDMEFIRELAPQMVGIGPFISHHDTPFSGYDSGTLEETLFMLSLLRLMLPKALIPATTALGTIHPEGREKGILAGANVVMPNLSPLAVRKKYMIYDNKIATGEEAAESRMKLAKRMESIGYELSDSRGDHPDFRK